MAKILSSKLNLNKETTVGILSLDEENSIEVLKYLPLREKVDLVNISIQESLIEPGVVSRLKFDALLHLYMVFSYTNISFTKKQKDEPFETYDLLEKNGLIDKIVELIPEQEYEDLIEKAYSEMENYENQSNSVVGVVKNFIASLPDTISLMNSALGDVDEEKITSLLSLTKQHGAE